MTTITVQNLLIIDCRHFRCTFAIFNPANPRPVSVKVGDDPQNLNNIEVIKNGCGIIFTEKDGVVASTEIGKKGTSYDSNH